MLACDYGFQPSEVWAMDGWELRFWIAQAAKRNERNRHG